MANLQGCFRRQIDSGARTARSLLRGANKVFFESTPPDQYATAFFGRSDDCGHLPPALLRASGEVLRLEPCATVLGAFRNWDCAEQSVEMAPGDCLLVFSDGTTEAGIDEDEEFGDARVVTLAQSFSPRVR